MNYEQEESKYLLHTYKRNYVNFTDADGCKLYDKNGKSYIDFMSGIAVNSVGYRHPALIKAVNEAVNGIHHISNLFYIDSQVEAAKKSLLEGIKKSQSQRKADLEAAKNADKHPDGSKMNKYEAKLANVFRGEKADVLRHRWLPVK